MKKIILSLGMLLLFAGMAMAQGKKHKKNDAATETPQSIATPAAPAEQSICPPIVEAAV